MLFRSDRKSTRLNSSHTLISYAVFCLKKKNYAATLMAVTPKNAWTCVRSLLHSVYEQPDSFFFFNDTATTEIYTLSLHDALPILRRAWPEDAGVPVAHRLARRTAGDRKSTRLNSSHTLISYAVFCLKKKKDT